MLHNSILSKVAMQMQMLTPACQRGCLSKMQDPRLAAGQAIHRSDSMPPLFTSTMVLKMFTRHKHPCKGLPPLPVCMCKGATRFTSVLVYEALFADHLHHIFRASQTRTDLQGAPSSQAVCGVGMQPSARSARPEGLPMQKPCLPKRPGPTHKYASAFHAASQKAAPVEQGASSSTTRECDTEPSETPNAATQQYQRDVYRGKCVLCRYPTSL